MDPSGASWIIPAAGQVWKQREDIAGVWERITSKLLRKKSRVAITGMFGAGETVLLAHLSGEAYEQGYVPPQGYSQETERGKLPTKKRVLISVIPGQNQRPRIKAIEELLGGKSPVEGIIHVVCNGFVEIRDPAAIQLRISGGQTGIDHFRRQIMREELQDLEATCVDIRNAIRRRWVPRWMLVAVAKADLYATEEEMRIAQAYHSPYGESEFTKKIHELVHCVGSDNFRWDTLPVSAWLEDFRWNQETRKTMLQVAQRDELLSRFSERLEAYCGN